jgi:hypothetical protein
LTAYGAYRSSGGADVRSAGAAQPGGSEPVSPATVSWEDEGGATR